MRHLFLARAASLPILVLGFAAAAQNLVQNPSFSSGLTGWTNVFNGGGTGGALPDALNAPTVPVSGSALIFATGANPSQDWHISQCLPATAGTSYDFGGQLFIPSGQANTGGGSVGLAWFSDNACTFSIGGGISTGYYTTPGAWILAGTSNRLAPAGTVRAAVFPQVIKNEANGALGLYWDNIYFEVSGTTTNLVQNPGFSSGLTGWTNVFTGGGTGGAIPDIADASSVPGFGSAVIFATGAIASQDWSISQCLPATAGASYDFGGQLFIPSGQANTGGGSVGLAWFSDNACTFSIGGGISTGYYTTPGAWISASTTNRLAPGGTVRAVVFPQTIKNEADGSLAVLWDNVFFGPTGCVFDTTAPSIVPPGALTLTQTLCQ